MASKTKKITSIGGSALIEGIMMRGPKRNTVCVRTGKDEIYRSDRFHAPELQVADALRRQSGRVR